MYTTNCNIAKNLSNYIKNHPLEFSDCTSKLVEKFVLQLDLDLPSDEINKLRAIYQFIVMYSLITANLNTVRKLMNNSKTITTIIEALIINRNLVLKQQLESVDVMVKFGQTHNVTLASRDLIALSCCCFNTPIFYKAIKYMTNTYCNKTYE